MVYNPLIFISLLFFPNFKAFCWFLKHELNRPDQAQLQLLIIKKRKRVKTAIIFRVKPIFVGDEKAGCKLKRRNIIGFMVT